MYENIVFVLTLPPGHDGLLLAHGDAPAHRLEILEGVAGVGSAGAAVLAVGPLTLDHGAGVVHRGGAPGLVVGRTVSGAGGVGLAGIPAR